MFVLLTLHVALRRCLPLGRCVLCVVAWKVNNVRCIRIQNARLFRNRVQRYNKPTGLLWVNVGHCGTKPDKTGKSRKRGGIMGKRDERIVLRTYRCTYHPHYLSESTVHTRNLSYVCIANLTNNVQDCLLRKANFRYGSLLRGRKYSYHYYGW